MATCTTSATLRGQNTATVREGIRPSFRGLRGVNDDHGDPPYYDLSYGVTAQARRIWN
jgi:hypothetical protein